MVVHTMPVKKKHLFGGDDLEYDYRQPQRMGMNAVLLDIHNAHPDIAGRIISLSELPDINLLDE